MEIIANSVQTVLDNANVLFTNTAIAGNCSILHREGSGLVTLRGLTNQCRARFRIAFNGNVAIPTGGTAGPITLAISLDGESLGEGTMISTPAAAAAYDNISATVFIDVPRGCCESISIKNDSGVSINIENANLIIERVA